MYTQCPDCSTAFRVTAEVLKQAAGKVRCGGCGIAFNALEYLSEQMPEQPGVQETEGHLPELTPEPRQPEERAPMAISAEQSAALLKTLDELAGSDIRIEDTGVEWRVLDDDAADVEPDINAAARAQGVDELLDESPTPVDQFLTKTPNNIDAREIFEESAGTPAQTPVDELRFDDNTPLPDDFDVDDESSQLATSHEADEPDAGARTEAALQPEHPRDVDDAPVDIGLDGPDEWADILGEFAEPHEPYVPPLDAELSALEEVDSENGHDDESAVAEEPETPLDMDTQFALQAEAMGIDLSGLHAAREKATVEHSLDEDSDEPEVAEAPETDERHDDAHAEATVEHAFDESSDEPEVTEAPETDEQNAEAPAIDAAAHSANDFVELQLAETGEAPQLSGAQDEAGDDDEDEAGDGPELELADATGEPLPLEDGLDKQSESTIQPVAEDAAQDHSGDEDSELEVQLVDVAPLEFGSIEKAMAELEEQSDVFDKGLFDAAATDEAATEDEFDDDENILENKFEDDDNALDDELASSESDAHEDTPDVLPEQSEEELTLNRLIDQELLSMAVEDEEGFASTIVVADNPLEKALADAKEQQPGGDAGAGFESIIMEGEFVRTALDQEKRKADIAEAAALAEKARQAREAEAQKSGGGNRRRMAAAAAGLALLLVVQVLHQSREALATIPAFNDTVGSLYRAIGMPLAPAWDVTSWRFEARRDILDEDTGTLTVISRIGNTSGKPLPYPLVNISLTDRFEETIGTKTLDPVDYLTDDLDASKMVQPGNNFTAVMTIESPSENATGYKLQACYQQPDAQLRCHIPTFK